MKRKLTGVFIAIYCIGIAPACASETPVSEITGTEETSEQKVLGSLPPEKALEYMKTTENLLIIDVASVTNYNRIHFEGAINIPIENIITPDQITEAYTKVEADKVQFRYVIDISSKL